jgi:hypothetical protein
MLIGEKYKVESDSLNVTVYEKVPVRKYNSFRWQPIAYFSSFKNALKSLVDLEVMKTGLKDFQKVVKKQDEIYRLIKSLEIA